MEKEDVIRVNLTSEKGAEFVKKMRALKQERVKALEAYAKKYYLNDKVNGRTTL
ncbi:MAG: hypothetical protein MJZ14_10975 [Paludibacteraceae bacterium]|nr:hypothetical protein [Paludibacteraceae bacterium]